MSDQAARLRVVTWNIHGYRGRDGRHDPLRVGAHVRRQAPDIAAFQEVDTRAAKGSRPSLADELRAEVGDHGHYAWSLTGEDGDYGQMLASRLALEDARVHDISVPGREPRRVLEAKVRSADLELRIVATHLGLAGLERRRQLGWLCDIVAADPTTPRILLGDFNLWRRGGRTQGALSALFDVWTTQATFPSRWPVFPLDRIWLRPGGLLVRSWIARNAADASDHLPVGVELRLDPAAAGL